MTTWNMYDAHNYNNTPLVNFALFISEGNSDGSDSVQFKLWVVLMEVGRHPAYPNIVGLLAREDSH